MSFDRALVVIVSGGPGLNGKLSEVGAMGRPRFTGYDEVTAHRPARKIYIAYLPSSRMNGGVSLE
jgi:hypothetical protein